MLSVFTGPAFRLGFYDHYFKPGAYLTTHMLFYLQMHFRLTILHLAFQLAPRSFEGDYH